MTKNNYLLDTNTFSYIVKGNSPAARREWLRLSLDPTVAVCISVVTEAEVRYGMTKHAISRERANNIERLLANTQILAWGSDEAAAYANLRVHLERKGITLSAMDMMIAAQAIAAEAILVTRDQIFKQVSDLSSTVNWATDL